MKKLISITLLISILTVLMVSCQTSGHKQQSWAPKTGKKMRAGHNNK